MSAITTVLLVLAALALFAVRPIDKDARTPIEELLAARTPAEIRAAARSAGWPKITARTLQITVVVVLLLLIEACRIGLHTINAIGTIITVIEEGIAALGVSTDLQGGRA